MLVLALLNLAAALIIFGAPPNLVGHNEHRMAAYVEDLLENGHWSCQLDEEGQLSSKPPLYAWLSAGLARLAGRVTPLTLYLPNALSTALLTLLLCRVGAAEFGAVPGFLAGLFYLFSPAGLKSFATARFDPLFSFTVALAALAGYRAWKIGRGWIWFWLGAVAATLAKGPLGLVLAGGGLLAARWPSKTDNAAPFRGRIWPGLILYLAITAGWFLLACSEFGSGVVQKMISYELVEQNLNDQGARPLVYFYRPFLNFLWQLAPWSFLAVFAMGRVVSRPSASFEQRRFERFLSCWFVFGLALFSLSAHQRSELVLPLFAPAALLAARELARARWLRLDWLAGAIAVVGLGLAVYYFYAVLPRGSRGQTTRGLAELARHLERKVGRHFPITHLDSPFAFRFLLDETYPLASPEESARLINGSAPAFLAVHDRAKFEAQLGPAHGQIYVLARWPDQGEPFLSLLSNQGRLERPEEVAFAAGEFVISLRHAKLHRAGRNTFVFEPARPDAALRLRNASARIQRVSVGWMLGSSCAWQTRSLGPGEDWQSAPK